jgi:hypothetical protein
MFKKTLCSLLVLFFCTVSAQAVDVGGLTIPDSLETGQGALVLNGAGIRKKFGFKVYVGGLYLKARTSDSRAIVQADEPMAITMTWKRTATVDKIGDVFSEGFTYAAGADYDAIKGDIDRFLSALVNAEQLDVWTYLYLPGKGLDVVYKDKTVQNFSDFRFKKALFSVWLLEGETFTGDTALRDGMLGK